MEGSRPAVPAEPGTLKTSLEATPGTTLDYSHQQRFRYDCVQVTLQKALNEYQVN